MSGYGTLSHEREFEWEKNGEPTSLLMHMSVSFGKQLAALLLLFWQLIHQKSLLMTCDARIVGLWVYPCEYTKTFVRCFPLVAASVVLLVGNRCMLQQRIYYGLLKRGGLLDFKNTKAWHDPLFFILLVCFFHGICHFLLDCMVKDGGPLAGYMEDHVAAPGMTIAPQSYQSELMHEAENMVKNFALPSMIFFAFLCTSYDIESSLVSLSKYFEEDPQSAKHTASHMQILDEDAVSGMIPHLSLKKSSAETSLHAVYSEITQLCPDRPSSYCGTEIEWRLFGTLWPSKILLDPRLRGPDAERFRRMAILVKCFSLVVMSYTFGYFAWQAVKDFNDVRAGMWEDSCALFVLLLHAGIVAWILKVVVESLLVVFEPVDHRI